MKFTNYNVRLVILAIILVIAVLLIVLLISNRSANRADTSMAVAPSVEVVIQKLLLRFQIDDKSIRTRKVPSGDGKFVRIERRITVAPEFNAMSFNHELNNAVASLGATAIATEKSEDKTVTVHVKKNGVIVESIVFLARQN